MRVLVDTPIWSLVLRRRRHPNNEHVTSELAALVNDSRVAMIGPVRQEILSGIRERAHFDRLREHLRAFSDLAVTVDDYEQAADFFNRCRENGIQGSNTDFLICAVAVRNELPIFTTDGDFAQFAKILPIALYGVTPPR
jgi:predicted nucleic acid-binding protein